MVRAHSPKADMPAPGKLAAKAKAPRAHKPVAAPPAVRSGLADAHRQDLVDGAIRARENNGSMEFSDRENRTWFVGVMNVENHSHVLIQVRRGEAVRERYLSTATFTPDLVSQAIADLDGELP